MVVRGDFFYWGICNLDSDLSLYFLWAVALLVALYNSYMGRFFFKRFPNLKERDKKEIENGGHGLSKVYSPVDGKVVYINKGIDVDELTICKLDRNVTNGSVRRKFKVSDSREPYLEAGVKYSQIGIFMSTFNNHHYVHPFSKEAQSIEGYVESIEGGNVPMVTFKTEILKKLNMVNWDSVSEGFLVKNEQYYIKYDNGIVVCITMDKYVNKLSKLENPKDPRVQYFIHRGSQADIFIPEILGENISLNVGDSVAYHSEILWAFI